MDFEEDFKRKVENLEVLVNDGYKRLCHKVRTSKYYGGIATVDVVGCYLDCCFCWVPEFKRYSELIEQNKANFKFLSPEETANILINLAERNKLESVRLSGGEPTLNKPHLLRTIELTTNKGLLYILETNGLLIDEDFIDKLLDFRDKICIYYGLKSINPRHFHIITGNEPKLWYRQIKNLVKLINNGFTLGINLMADFYPENLIIDFIYFLNSINEILPMAVDIKQTSLFPHVSSRLSQRKIEMLRVVDKEKYSALVRKIMPDTYNYALKQIIEKGSMNFINFANV